VAKAQTTTIGGGAEYAKVSERLRLFREANPNGSIKTTHQFLEDGKIIFTTYILSNKADENSSDATGSAYGELKNPKAFEKLESISVGRALALLGYLASGEIASSEEMIEFQEYKAQQEAVMLEDATERLMDAKDIKELGTIWASIPAEAKLKLSELKDNLKKGFMEKTSEDK
jgi:hypothetical protein